MNARTDTRYFFTLFFLASTLFLALSLSILSSRVAQALACDVPSDTYPTIQSAVNDSACDLVNLTAPLYVENVAISRTVAIQGQGQASTTVDGGQAGTVLAIAPGVAVTLTNMTITGGLSDDGGGIYHEGTNLTLQEVTVSDNDAHDNGAGIYSTGNGMVAVINSTLSNNHAGIDHGGGRGGGIYNESGMLIVKSSTLNSNRAGTSEGLRSRRSQERGGAIYNQSGAVTVNNSTISDNRSGYGGGIDNIAGTVTVTASSITANENISNNGGGIHNESGTVTVLDSAIIGNYSDDNGSGAGISNNGVLVVRNTLFEDNVGSEFGGAIQNSFNGNVSIIDSRFHDNGAEFGDTLGNDNGGVMSIVNSTLDGRPLPISNVPDLIDSESYRATIDNDDDVSLTGDQRVCPAFLPCAAVYNDSGATMTVTASLLTGFSDGAILNNAFDSSLGQLTLIDSEISLSGHTGREGGGVYNVGNVTFIRSSVYDNIGEVGAGVYSIGGSVTISDSTFYNNNAIVYGGGVYLENTTLLMHNSTFSRNSAARGGGLYVAFDDGSGGISGSNISLNSASNANGGGGIYCAACALPINGNSIYANRTGPAGNVHNNLTNASPAGSPNLDARNNYWGPAQMAAVEATIWHGSDDSVLASVDYVPFLGRSPVSVLVNPGFERGPAIGWATFSLTNNQIITTTRPHIGDYSAHLCVENGCTDFVEQRLVIPRNARLGYRWFMASLEGTNAANDFLRVELYELDGTLIAALRSWDNTSPRNSWQGDIIDLSPWAGQAVLLRFTATTNGTLPTGFAIDTVGIR